VQTSNPVLRDGGVAACSKPIINAKDVKEKPASVNALVESCCNIQDLLSAILFLDTIYPPQTVVRPFVIYLGYFKMPECRSFNGTVESESFRVPASANHSKGR